MRQQVEESVAPGVAAGRGRGGRFSAGRKREVVRRLLRGEDLESVSRAVGSRRRGRRTGGLSFWLRGRRAERAAHRMLGTKTLVGCRPRSASC